MSGTYGLRFGSIDFSPAAQVGDVEYRVYGLKRGRVVPVTSVVESMLQDGAVERVDRHENRDQTVVIGVKSADSAALAQAESDLFLEAQKVRNEFAWSPPDGFGETTVFDVLWAVLDFADDADDWDLDELRGHRVYTLTIRTLPFGRSESEVVDEALTSGVVPATVTIADGSSATGWTGALVVTGSPSEAGTPATVTASGGTLRVTSGLAQYAVLGGTQYNAGARFALAMSSTDFTATPYVSFEYANQLGTTNAVAAVDGQALTLVADEWSATTNGWRRATFLCTDASATSLAFTVSTAQVYPTGTTGPSSVTFQIRNVKRSNQAPNASSTGRESMRTVWVGGSARTQASLSVEHPTDGLGDVLVYTCPALGAGYQPDLRRWRTSGGTVTADASTVSGSREVNSSSIIFNAPAAGLPRGSYALMARVRSSSGSTVTRSLEWSVATKIGSSTFGTQSGTAASQSLDGVTFSIIPLGVVTLPPTDVAAGSSGTVEIKLPSSGTYELDEAWIFYLGEDAALTQVACGSGTPVLGTAHNRLWLDSASLDRYEPAVWMGTQADRSDAFHAGDGAPAWGIHSFTPTWMQVYVVTTGAANPSVPLRRFRRFHTHAYHEAS